MCSNSTKIPCVVTFGFKIEQKLNTSEKGHSLPPSTAAFEPQDRQGLDTAVE